MFAFVKQKNVFVFHVGLPMNDRRRDDQVLKDIRLKLNELAKKVGKTSDLGIRIEVTVQNIHEYIERCQDEKDRMVKRLSANEVKISSVSTNQKIINYVLGGTFIGVIVKFVAGLLFAAKKM